jgi:hypothetical protein
MVYKIFDALQEPFINQFLEENKLLIGKDSITFPEPGKIAFLLMDEFDPEIVGTVLLQQKWRKEYDEVMEELADNIQKIEWMKMYKPEEKVGEREGASIGATRSILSVSAKDGIAQLTERNQLLFRRKKALETLLTSKIKGLENDES